MALQTATNPETGEKVALVNGEWLPISQTATNEQGQKAYFAGNRWITDKPEKTTASTERTLGESFKDIGADVISGVGRVAQLPGQLYGLATGDFSKTGTLGMGEAIEKYGDEMKSVGLREREARRSEAIKEAEKTGQWAAFKTAVGQTVSDPALFFSFLAQQAPQLIPAIITGGGTAALTSASVMGKQLAKGVAKEAAETAAQKAAIKAGTTAAVQTGAVQQGTDIGAGTYDEVYKYLTEQKKMSPEQAASETINLARAAGVSGYALSLIANKYLPGGSAMERAFAGERTGAGRIVGGVTGALKEIPGENIEEVGGKIAQNIAARQAGMDRGLLEGTGETAGMATVGAAGMGGVTGVLAGKRKAAPEAPPAPETETIPDWIKKDLEGESDVEQPITPAGGVGAGVAGESDTGLTATGARGAKPDGVVSTGQDAAGVGDGEETKPGALTDFKENYENIRSELAKLQNEPRPTPGQIQMMKRLSADLNALVDANAEEIVKYTGDPGLVENVRAKNDYKKISAHYETLKNPTFDATEILRGVKTTIGQPKAMQGDLFGNKAAINGAAVALAQAGGDHDAAVQLLEDRRQRVLDAAAKGEHDAAWAINRAEMFKMSRPEAAKNPKVVSDQFVKQQAAIIDASIAEVERLRGQPKAMQGDMFGYNKKIDEDKWAGVKRTTKGDVEIVPTASLNGVAQRNKADTNSPEYAVLKASIEANGIVDPITLTTNSLGQPEVFEGNHRLQAARELGITDIPVVLHSRSDRSESQPVVGRKPSSLLAEYNASRAENLEDVFAKTEKELANERARELSADIISRQKKEKTEPIKTTTQVSLFATPVKKEQPTTQPAERTEPNELDTYFESLADESVDESTMTDEEVAIEAERQALRDKVNERQEAPKEDTENIAGTEEAGTIGAFFDAIKPTANTPSETAKHNALKQTGRDLLTTEYDIAKSGEKTTPGMQKALKYLARRVGGQAKLSQLIEDLRTPGNQSQSRILENAGLPDLTTRRGMEQFNDELKEFQTNDSPEAGGVKIPFGKLPYVSEATTVTTKTVDRGPTPEGKLRKPVTRNETTRYVISDNKLRSAWNFLKSAIAARGNVTEGMTAARSYITNPNRKNFGDVLSALAYDIAMYEAGVGRANAIYVNEGGKYAVQFKEWIEQNLNQDTVDVLNNMVGDYRNNLQEEEKFEALKAKYDAAIKAGANKKIEEVETTTGVKIPRAPRIKKELSEEQRLGKNLPTVQKLTELQHPDIMRLLDKGDTKGALKILAAAPKNAYYSALAKRLLESGVDAETEVIGQNEMVSLSNDPAVKDTLDAQLSALANMVSTGFPKDKQSAILKGLKSNNLFDLNEAIAELENDLENPSQRQILNETIALLKKEYGWLGKYDPRTNKITMRQGYLTNHLFLHEAMHAATSRLIDNPKSLQGPRLDAYNRLNEIYNYSKGILSRDGMNIDNIQNLHEFVSEAMTNPELQALLRDIRYKAAPISVWNEFTNAVKKLFGATSDAESNAMVEVMNATDIMISGPISFDVATESSGPKAMSAAAPLLSKPLPPGLANSKTAIQKLFQSKNWNEVKGAFPTAYSSAKASVRPALLGALTLRQIDDLVRKRIPQVGRFIATTEAFLSRKNGILKESSDILKLWERKQASDPEMSRLLARVMHAATIAEVHPDSAFLSQRQAHPELMKDWRGLDSAAKAIYIKTRDFYDKRYEEYKAIMEDRIDFMQKELGISEGTATHIRDEFEKNKRKGPYFPLMRHGRFWYQIGKGSQREYYMFETEGQRDVHMQERMRLDPNLEVKYGSEYKQQMDLHAKQSEFLKATFKAIDDSTITTGKAAEQKQLLKDSIYQNFLSNQPEHSFRSQFMHRNNVAGYSEDALRNFASSSFHMAYQMARFEHAPDLFAAIQAAKMQLAGRKEAGKQLTPELTRENTELSDYVTEMGRRLDLMLNPTDVGTIPSLLSNIGFIWYLTAPASAIVNVLGGMIIGLPTLVGQNVRANPKLSYTQATLDALGQMRQVAGQVMATGFDVERSKRIRDNRVDFPSLSRSDELSNVDKAAYDRFVADGVIDITAAYDQSGLAAAPTDSYGGVKNRAMELMSSLFHNAERFNREVMAMSAFRAAMAQRKDYKDQTLAFSEAIEIAKDSTQRSMFDYSSVNKPRYFQNPVARVVLQFKQFPQQMTFFLVHNFINMSKGLTVEDRREARARFVGTMGMAGIFSGVTGLWGFSTVAMIANALVNGLKDEDDEKPFDFELEFIEWAADTFGKNAGTLLTRGVGNMAGVDLASRTKLDDMWFQDPRKNLDATDALQERLVSLLGPTVGLAINATDAYNLWNTGHADRAIEKISPAFIRNPLVAARYANEGVNNLRGDPLVEDVGSFSLLMQSIGLRPADVAEIQFANIVRKGQEQKVLKERQNLLNLYGIAFMANDSDTLEKAYERIDKFNDKHPSVWIPAKTLTKSIKERMTKSAQTENGLYIDKRLRGVLDDNS